MVAQVAAVQHAEVWSSITSWDRKAIVMGDVADPDSDVCSALKKRRRGLESYSRIKSVLMVMFQGFVSLLPTPTESTFIR